MLTVIIPAGSSESALASLLSRLVPAAVDGLVSQVVVVGGGDGAREICEDAGADLTATFAAAVAAARKDWLLVLPTDLRLADGWDGALGRHLAAGGGAARLESVPGGLLARLRAQPSGVLVRAGDVKAPGAAVDLLGLRRQHGRARIGL